MNKNWNLFLDDERYPSDSNNSIKYEHIARSCEDAIYLVNKFGLPSYISFDHDLGENSRSGMDFAHWLVEYHLNNDINPSFDFYVHSMNPVGKLNIEMLLNNFKKSFK